MVNHDKVKDRAAGAVVGALIGDALGLGPHWYYDLEQMRMDFGPWIDGYTEPKPGRYHEGLKAGNLSQTGDYADNSEGAERAVVLAARYAISPTEGAQLAARNIRLTQIDPFVVALSASYNVIVSALIRGEPFNGQLSAKLYALVEKGVLPFTHAVLAENKEKYMHDPTAPSASLPYPDGLLFPSHIWQAANDPDVAIEPGWNFHEAFLLALRDLLPSANLSPAFKSQL